MKFLPPPHSSVTIFLGLNAADEAFVYKQRVNAAADGSFELIFPYSSAGSSSSVVATAPIQLLVVAPDARQRVVSFQLTEQAVLEHERVALGDLRGENESVLNP